MYWLVVYDIMEQNQRNRLFTGQKNIRALQESNL